MIINITSGKGIGDTEITAFDAALFDAGINDYNLIILSSIIPPRSEILIKKLSRGNHSIGNKLYIVLSKNYETRRGKKAYAGLGWRIREDGSGIFLEEHGENEEELIDKLREGLKSMVKYRDGIFGEPNYKIEEIECIDKPVCALVAAVYKDEGWE